MFNRFNLISGSLMAFIYAACGVLLLIVDTPYLTLPESYKTILGSAMIAYAVFRSYRLYKIFKSSDREAENENQNI